MGLCEHSMTRVLLLFRYCQTKCVEVSEYDCNFHFQGSQEPFFRFKRQTVKTAAGAEPNAADRGRMSAGRGDNIADDEGRASLSGPAGRFVQKIRTVVDHAVLGSGSENASIRTAAISERHVLSQWIVSETHQPSGQLRKLYCS